MTNLTVSVKDKLIAEIKAEAGRRILLIMPEWKQRNLTARGVQLMNIARLNGTLTTGEETEAAAIDAVWESTVVPIRAHSDQLETDVNNGVAVDIYSGWP
jgi:hypothetical protein